MMKVQTEKPWLRVLVDNFSSFQSLSSEGNIKLELAQKYYTRAEDVVMILKPVLEALDGSDLASNELLSNGFEELAEYFHELTELFQSWQPLSSRLYYVLEIESLVSNLRESSMEVFQLLTHCEHQLPDDLSLSSVECCLEKIKKMGSDVISCTIHKAMEDERDEVGPTGEILVNIAGSLGLRSNLEIQIEGVALESMKKEENESEAEELLERLIYLVNRMSDHLTEMNRCEMGTNVAVPRDFCCPLSLQLMTDPVIVDSGQTYERVFIQKWIDMGLMICPRTRQVLSNTTLIPNFTVKAFIANWCESNNVKKPPDPLELIQSCQPFPLLVQTPSSSESSSPRILGNGRQGGTESIQAPTMEELVLPSVLNRSVSAPRIAFPELSERPFPRIISSTITEAGTTSSSGVEAEVKNLVTDLESISFDTQRDAAARIRVLSRNSTENRIVIARCGAIGLLVNLLDSTNAEIQADAVTALLNLSINNNNKRAIAETGSIELLIHVLKTGTQEAKENAAATLFSLSVIEEYKIKIGRGGAIEPLVQLLGSASLRGKKDAATALFNLSIHHENKGRIVEAGAVRHLVELMDPCAGMVEKAVVVLANLATIKEGRVAIGEEGGIPALVEVVELGSSRGKENAAAALLQLCMHSPRFCNSILQEAAIPPLLALTKSGTARAREKAQNLLRCLRTPRQGNHRRESH